MEFSSRNEVYRWSEATRFQGRQAIVIRSGAYAHRFVIEAEGDRIRLLYQGMARTGLAR